MSRINSSLDLLTEIDSYNNIYNSFFFGSFWISIQIKFLDLYFQFVNSVISFFSLPSNRIISSQDLLTEINSYRIYNLFFVSFEFLIQVEKI